MSDMIVNKKATFNYDILERYEAGVVLAGYEVKALRNNQANLAGSFVIFRDGRPYLKNAHIAHYQAANMPKDYNPERERALLLTKKELSELNKRLNTAGLTVVPIKWYNKKRTIKLEIALVRGKKKADKRESIKARDVKRDIDRTLKMQ
jgi:SsrA-binding protein